MNKQKNQWKKRAFSFLLALILLFAQEVPAYARSLPGLSEKIDIQKQEKQQNEREQALFAPTQGRILSDNHAPGTDSALPAQQAEETRTDPSALRSPDLAQQTDQPGTLIKTGRYYRTWEMPDDTCRTVFTSYPNTYRENGQEKPIDNTLVSGNGTEKTYRNKASDIDVTLTVPESGGSDAAGTAVAELAVAGTDSVAPDTAATDSAAPDTAALTVSANRTETILQPESGNYTKAVVSENAIRYNEVYQNIDVQYTVLPNGIKQDIILLAPQERSTFTYILKKDGIRAELQDNCVYIYPEDNTLSANGISVSANDSALPADNTLSANGISASADTTSGGNFPAMIISAPQMTDAAGNSSTNIELRLKEQETAYELILTADSQWLSDDQRTYPIKIDPSTTVLDRQIDNFTVSSVAGPIREDTVSCTGFFDGIGKTRSYIITTFLYQSIMIEAGLTGVDVLSAKLDIYQINDNTGFDIGCYRLKDPLYYPDITWDNSVAIDRYAAGKDSMETAGKGWHSFDIRDSVSGWMNGIYDSHGLVLISTNETMPGAVFASENYPDTAYTPSITIEWQDSDMPIDYSLNDTTVNLRPMTLTTTDGKMQCYGVFADGLARPYSTLSYELSDTAKNYKGLILSAACDKTFPDSTAFESAFPAGTLRYRDVTSNWQTAYPFTDFAYDTLYSIKARAAYQDQTGSETKSDDFLIYRVTRYDTMKKIADYYGVPLETLLFDNKAADLLLVENNTLFIRNPKQNTPYQPAELTDEEKNAIDSALLGRALHCEFGFEPVNLNTGNFYLAQEDFSYTDSFGTFALTRSYNALNADRAGSFGRGFTSLFDESISALPDGSLCYNRQDGSSILFTPDGNGAYSAPEGYRLKLRREQTGQAKAQFSAGEQTYPVYRYTVTKEDDSTSIFDAGGNLIQTTGENGETLTIQRNSEGKLTAITREGVTMKITLTPEGFISSVTMPNGGVFYYEYDSRQNLTKVTDPLGASKRFLYDENHRMLSWYDENNTRIVQNTYDAMGRVVRQLDENGNEIRLEYQKGKTTATDARGNRTIYEYDDNYRTTAILYPDGSAETRQYRDNLLTVQTDRARVETTYTYDENGNITRRQTGDIENVYTYDSDGNLLTVTDPLGNSAGAEYDANGNLIKTIDEEGNTTVYAYDNRNRLIQKTDANGNRLTYHYMGNYLTETRTNEKVTGKFAYNALGQIVSYTDGEGNTSTFAYDAMGRNTVMKTPEGNTTAIVYGKTGLVQSVTDPLGGVTRYTYNKSNDILSMTDPMGNRYEYTYDAGGNRLSQKDPEGNMTGYEYDEMNRLIRITDSEGGIYTYTYDAHDNVICAKDPVGNSVTATYDPYYGQVAVYTDEEGIQTQYQYDAGGNLLSVTKDGVFAAAYTYNAKGQIISTELANGLKEMQEYDANGNCILRTDSEGRKTVFAYDEENRPVKETTAGGYQYHYTYDGAGNLTMVTAPGGITQTYTYDGDGNLLTETDGEGNTTAYAYDGNGNLIAETLPDETQFLYRYDAMGRLVSSADGRHYLTTYEYDKTGNLTGITDPLGQKTVYKWDSLGRNTSVTDSMGRETLYTYDANGNLLSETAPDGGVTGYTYDKKGRLAGMTDALNRETTYEYDAFDRIIKETDALGAVTRYEYDVTGNLTAQVDPIGNKTTYEYDLYGNPISRTDARGSRTEYEYDAENRLTAIRDARGSKAFMSYDETGNLILVKDPLGATESYTYDKAGRLTKEQSADGGVTVYTYDEVGNVITVTDSLSRTTEYQYDSAGNLIKMTNPKGNEVSYSYDARNRLISMIHEDGAEDLFAYDAADNLVAVKESGERMTEYAYDAMDRCIAVTDALGNQTSYEYDLCGNLMEETAPDGSRTAYAYDPVNRLTNKTLADGANYSYAYDKAGRIIKVCGPTGLETIYEYDSVGNVTALTKGGEGSDQQKTNYEYNSLNQIVEITDAMGGKTNYTYDKAGNLTGVTCADGALYRYEYDLAGNLIKTTDAAGLSRQFGYDTEGQLLSETSKGEGIDSTGDRTYTYSYDETGNLTFVKDPLGGVTGYTYDERNRLTETVSPKKAVTAYEYDSLSNLTMVTNAEGYRNTYTYDAKGRLTGESIAEEEHYAYGYDSCDRLIAVNNGTATASYTYDAMDRLTTVTDPNGESTVYTYDQAGNLLSITDPLGNRTENTYDQNGNLQSSIDPNDSRTTYDYDQLNRLTRKQTGDSLSDASYSYDSMGRLTKMNDITGETAYTYDAAGRLITAVDGDGNTLTYQYDLYGNITQVTYPDGGTVSYTYDALNRMTGVTDLTGRTTRYEYDKDGNLTRVIREDGETRIAYDKLGQITGLVNQYDGKTISAYGYAYDERGNITNEKIRLFQDGLTVEQEYIYQYDGMSQLIRSELTQLVGTSDGKKEHQTVTVTYAYDPAGNRLMMQTEADGATQKTTYTYDEAGRLATAEDSLTGQTRYTYDAAGNLIKEEGSRTRYYLYDASNRLSAVTDQENLLLAALYNGSDNRVFMMEYMPELIQKETDDTQNSPDADAPTAAGQDTLQAEQGSTGKNNAEEKEPQTLTGSYDQRENSLTQNNVTQNSPPGEAPLSEDQTGSNGFTAFWYGVLCQAADILLPSPTPFKTWLHDKMNFTDDITVLWEEEIYETDFSAAAETVQKEETPFDLISRAVADTTGQQLAADAYRQVSYVNDTTGANARVLAENITNGGMGDATVNYTYGINRESYTLTGCAPSAGNTPFAGISPATGDSAAAMTVRGTYYYTGTGSVANLISGSKKTAYTYTPGGTGTTYTTDSYKVTIRTTDGTTGIRQTYENYAYNGEYTHETPGIQYLRARYYNMTTGTFTSKDTYAGRIESILSQNRYTYAENNPVNFADPSGHAKTKSRLPSLQDNIRVAKGGNGPALKPTVNNPTDVAKAAYQSRRDAAGLPKENTLLDNVRIYNGQEYYNNLLLRTPIITLMSTPGGSFTYAESIAAKVEAARCMGYEYIKLGREQEMIEYDSVKIVNGANEYIIPDTIDEIIFDLENKTIIEYIFHPAYNWGASGIYEEGDAKTLKNEENRYNVAVGVGILDYYYPVTGTLTEEYLKNRDITLILQNISDTNTPNEMIEIPCVVADLKAHTYNKYPNEGTKTNLPYEVITNVPNGMVQTGIREPNATNALEFSPDDVSGMVIEFTIKGDMPDFNPNDYRLKEIIVDK